MILSACAESPYSKAYQGAPDARKWASYVSVPGDVRIYATDNFDRDIRALTRQSYSVVGQSSFSAAGNNATDGQLREQARKVGAQVVLVSSGYTHRTSGVLLPTLPQNTAAYSPANAAAYRPGGTANADVAGTTTTLVLPTSLTPYPIPRSGFTAVFLVKTFPRVGLSPGAIDEETRKRLKTNGGVKVLEVVDGSPAFDAHVLPGDILLRVGTERIQFVEQYIQALNDYQGRTVTFTFDRNGTIIEKELRIRPYPAAVH